MILQDVMDEVAEVLATITGLRMQAWPPATLTPPAGVVTYPAPPGIQYDQTYQRGETSIPDLEVHLVASRVTDRAARDQASAWTADVGESSVKTRLEAHAWKSCDAVAVTSAEFDTAPVGAVDYLDVIFHLAITGDGDA